MNCRDHGGDTPLHKACLSGETAIMEKIIAKLAETGDIHLIPNYANLTPLHIVCREGHTEIVDLLLNLGFNEERSDSEGINSTNKSTPLQLACESGKEQIVAILVRNRVDVMPVREDGITEMHIAAKHGHIKVMEELLKSLERNINVVDANERTPLHYAAKNNHVEMIKYLIHK